MVGELILERFRVESRIGSGGFGTVYRAWDEKLQRPVAVKVIESDAAGARVTREAQAVARLGHRNLATLYELAAEEGRAYLVSELIEGETLREMGRHGRLTDRGVATVGSGCAAALAHAHRSGVVHRDVKPENVMVTRAGEAKLVDFGIARVSGLRTLTRTGDVLGTLGYMAPEQAEGQRPGPAADVYSLCLTLYECLTGEHPRVGAGPADTARAISEPVLPLAEIRPDLPEGLSDVIDAGLDPDPELRPLASELEAALEAHGRDLDVQALPPVLRPDDETPEPEPISLVSRYAPAFGVTAVSLAALVVAAVPAPLALAAPAAGLVALARPRAGLAVGAGALIAWLLVTGEAGAALVVAAMTAPLVLIPAGSGEAVSLPGLAPLLGVAGLGPAYPAAAGLTAGPGGRFLLGAMGYLWLAACELATGRTLLIGPDTPAPSGWEGSLSEAAGGVLLPLLAPGTAAVAILWGGAALALPILVRGRVPVLDMVGALVWAAALISVHRLIAGPGSEPAGLLAASLLAACAAVLVARRIRSAPEGPPPGMGAGGARATL